MYAKVTLNSRTKALGAQISPIPAHLQGLDEAALADLAWTDPALGLLGLGYWPVIDHYPNLTLHQHYGEPTLVADKTRRVIVREWTAIALSGEALAERLAGLRTQQSRAVDAERDWRIHAGKPHTFPDGTTGTVQLRNERDTVNVNAVATAGTALTAMNSADTVVFRDAEDVTHALTGAEAVQFGLAVMSWVSAHYAAAWGHKDAIRALAKQGNLEALAAYDVSQGWPETPLEETAP